jgi:hypothetical protein
LRWPLEKERTAQSTTGRVFDNWRFLVTVSPILGACDDPSLFIEALIYKQRKQKICATSESFGLLVKLIRNRPLSALGDICSRGLPPTTVSPGG